MHLSTNTSRCCAGVTIMQLMNPLNTWQHTCNASQVHIHFIALNNFIRAQKVVVDVVRRLLSSSHVLLLPLRLQAKGAGRM